MLTGSITDCLIRQHTVTSCVRDLVAHRISNSAGFIEYQSAVHSVGCLSCDGGKQKERKKERKKERLERRIRQVERVA
jgi:hypothetical protein